MWTWSLIALENSPDHLTSGCSRNRTLSAALLLASGLAAVLLTSCESTGGKYGPGTGVFDTVIVDAGHGGHDQGAKSCSGAPEKALTLDTAHRLAACLRRNGLRVIETRPGDFFVTLGGRVDISNRTRRAVFVSVHYNWTKRRGAQGIEIYYDNRRSMRLAGNILKETLGAYHTSNRGIKNRGFYVLRNNRKPAVLCELGFVSCPGDNRNLQSPDVRQHLAERIAAGILAEQAGRIP